MSLRDLNARHLRLIGLYSSGNAIRGGTGLVFVVLVLITGLGIGFCVIDLPIQQARSNELLRGVEASDEEVFEEILGMGRKIALYFLEHRGADDAADDPAAAEEAKKGAERWVSYLMDEHPAVLSGVFLLLLVALPLLIGAGAFNQFSGDVQSRGLRYQLLRTERANIFFGRFLGTFLYSTFVVGLLLGLIVFYVGFKFETDGGQWIALITWSLWGFVALNVVCLPYVALCSWISAAIDSPFGSLLVCSLAIGAVPLFALIGRSYWEPLDHINHLMPWGVQYHLLHPDPLIALGAAAACLGYTAVFLGIGYRHFAKRDL